MAVTTTNFTFIERNNQYGRCSFVLYFVQRHFERPVWDMMKHTLSV